MSFLRKHWLPWMSAALIAAPIAACGDDDDESSGDAGVEDAGDHVEARGRGTSGKGGSGGKAGSGDRAGSGSSVREDDKGSSGEGGSDAAVNGRADVEGRPSEGGGGSGGAASGGDNGSADEDAGVEPGPTFAAITRVNDVLIPQINDLRGLKYAADGKIWASGFTDADATNRQLVLARFNADGTLDTSFDTDGWVTYDAASGAMNDEQSIDLALLSGGDVIVLANVSDGQGGAALTDTAGVADGVRSHGQNVELIRFSNTGAPVTSWGNNGRLLLNFGWEPAQDSAWPAPIYTSTNMENQQYYRPGTGTDPMTNPPLAHTGFPSDTGWGLEVDNRDGIERLVVFGFGPAKTGVDATQRYDNDRYILRILADSGELDPTFNGGAAFTFNTLTADNAFPDGGRRGFVEADGSIVAAGYTNYGMGLGNHVLLLRLNADGTPDSTFGFGLDPARPGAARTNPFLPDQGVTECYQVARQSTGRYITTGYGRATGMGVTASTLGFQVTDGVDLVSVGINASGTGIDPSYGVNGMIAVQSEMLGLAGTEDRGRDLVVLADDRVVHAGRFGASPTIFVTTPDGDLDESVGDDASGRFAYTPSAMTANSHFYAIALSSDRRHIAATTNNAAEGARIAILEVAASN